MPLSELVREIDRLKAELDALRPLEETRLRRWRQRMKLDWNYHSNSIEGNTLTESETRTFLLSGITAKGKPFRDYLEMKGHNEALSKLFELVHDDLEITESLIKDLHRIILVEPYEDRQAEIQPGQWRQLPNYLYGKLGERIDFAPPADVPRLMNDLINWLNNHLHPPKRKRKRYDLHPLVIAAGFHQQFIAIHPFGDGNGRMARILTNLILMIAGYVPLIVRTEDREEYFAAINVSDVDESATLAQFFGERLLVSLRLAIKAGKGKDLETMREREAGLRALNDRLTDEP